MANSISTLEMMLSHAQSIKLSMILNFHAKALSSIFEFATSILEAETLDTLATLDIGETPETLETTLPANDVHHSIIYNPRPIPSNSKHRTYSINWPVRPIRV